MSISRKNNKGQKTPWVWTILLSIVLLFGQSVKLHVHSLDHAQDQHQIYNLAAEHGEHSNLAGAHLSIDNSHSDHHAENAVEIDTSPNALLKDLSSKVLALALLITLLLLFLPGFNQLLLHRLHSNNAIFPRRYLLSPPLRAPPL